MERSWRAGWIWASPANDRSTLGGPTTEKKAMKAVEKLSACTLESWDGRVISPVFPAFARAVSRIARRLRFSCERQNRPRM